ncbi:VanZ family protein [Spirillospora sp. NPDC050679]
MPDHVPIEAIRALALWALTVAAAGLAVWRPLVRRTRWARWPTLTLLVWTGLVLSMTLPMRAAPGFGGRMAHCAADPVRDIVWSVQIFGTRGLEDAMNVALWAPCGFLAVLATRRPVAAPALLAAGFVGVEFLQAIDPGRECDPGDWLYNSAGIALGAAVACLVSAVAARSRGPARDRSPR